MISGRALEEIEQGRTEEKKQRESGCPSVKVRTLLRQQLAGWQEDLPPSWQRVLEGVELDFDHQTLDRTVHRGELMLPRRKGALVPESPSGARIFRAFDGVGPESVRAIILGQDPYPKLSWATGRAFEQGNLNEWPENHRLIAPVSGGSFKH